MQIESDKYELIINSLDDGMVAIDNNERIFLFNHHAEEITGILKENALGRNISEVIRDSGLPFILTTRRMESNREMVFENGCRVMTSRIPIIEATGRLLGAYAVFQELTKVVKLAEEMTDIKKIQSMLEAVVQSSEDAISAVDEKGKGLLINPAYTRLTGLTKEQVIGKPAVNAPSAVESMHLKVLKTRRSVNEDVIIDGSINPEVTITAVPIIVNGKLKGSVGVIHDMSEVRLLTGELNQSRQMIRAIEGKYIFEDIIGESEEMVLAIEQAKLGAKTTTAVLLRGESGTGKDLFACAIHNTGDRKYNKFIRVHCAAITESVLEKELFGYEERAFAEAEKGGKKGIFEEANNGSVFLDEIGELSIHMQEKLLRVLRKNEIIRIGGSSPTPINVRIIAATNVNLEKRIANGAFREDLYYRLNRMPVHIPPLRNRKEEIPLLVKRLLQKMNHTYGRGIEGVTEAAFRDLREYNWPGNIRELENVLGRAVIFMGNCETHIDIQHLPVLKNKHIEPESSLMKIEEKFQGKSLAEMVEQYEAQIIRQTMKHLKGNKTLTAKTLGLSLRNLYYKLEKYNLEDNGTQ